MATRKSLEIKQGLTKKGFITIQNDHTFLFFTVEGRKSSIRTKISHGTKEYGDNLLSFVAKQLKISTKQLNNLLDCPLSYEDYLSILINKKALILK